VEQGYLRGCSHIPTELKKGVEEVLFGYTGTGRAPTFNPGHLPFFSNVFLVYLFIFLGKMKITKVSENEVRNTNPDAFIFTHDTTNMQA
jgi:hypothetical protein